MRNRSSSRYKKQVTKQMYKLLLHQSSILSNSQHGPILNLETEAMNKQGRSFYKPEKKKWRLAPCSWARLPRERLQGGGGGRKAVNEGRKKEGWFVRGKDRSKQGKVRICGF